MKTIKLDKTYKIQVPASNAFTINTSPNFIKLHAVILAIAKRGTGKTLSLTNLLRLMHEDGALDRLILVSPTFHNNRHYFEGLPLSTEDNPEEGKFADVIEPDKYTADEIIKIMDEEGQAYDEYFDKIKKYRKLMRLIKSKRVLINNIDPDLLLEFGEDLEPPKPRYECYKQNRRPHIVCFFDDCQGNPLFRPSSSLSSLVIKHRHQGKTHDGAIGVSLMFATQTYTSNAAGLLPAIRNNTTHLMVFRTKSERELDMIAEECAGEVPVDTFKKVHEFATHDNPHAFLFVDLAKKDEHPSMFRKSFDEFILVDD
jgi:hypothetical protein